MLDLPGLHDLLTKLHRRELSLVEVETQTASPFASSLLFDYVATYMYEGDQPNAERRAAALALDRELLRELLGQEELRELIDPGALATVEADLQRLSDRTRADTVDGVARRAAARRRSDVRRGEAARRRRRRGWTSCAASGGRSSCASAARSAGSRPRTLGSTATRWAPCRRPGCRRRSSPTSRTRWSGSSAATRAPTGRSRRRELRDRYGLDLTPVLERLEQSGHLVRGELRPGGTSREWCDPEVLRRLRRASLAALRAEIEPADQRAFARFQASLAGRRPPPADRRGRRPAARDPRPAAGPAAAAGGVGARRAAAPHRRLLARVDGPAVRVGRDRVGRRGRAGAAHRAGRAVLPRRRAADRAAAELGRGAVGARARGDPRAACRPARASSPTCSPTSAGSPTEELQNGLWDLVWAGEATNDAFAPLRSPKLTATPAWSQRARASRRSFSARRRGGQPAVQGRWSLTASLFGRDDDPVARRRTQAELLLERYGIVTREQVLAEGIPGGFSSLYDSLAALETIGVARRGYFVEGLGGAQFALPGAVERLRAQRDDDAAPPVVLAATDPAQPYGAALKWPDTPAPPRPAGRRLRRAGGRRAGAVRRARRQGPAGAGRGRRPAHRSRRWPRWPSRSSAAGSSGSRWRRSTASRSSGPSTRRRSSTSASAPARAS